MRKIAEAAWQCGDPGIQFHTTINKWHTSKATAPINASNPCSEYMFLDDSACNLASLNLMKFLTPDGKFDVEAFRQAVDIMITAQEILVDNASYPDGEDCRKLARLPAAGAGLREPGRAAHGRRLALRFRRRPRLCRRDHRPDARRGLSAIVAPAPLNSGPARATRVNRDPFLGVISMHRQALQNINPRHVPENHAGRRQRRPGTTAWRAA